MKSYIGAKIIQAEPMDELTFLRTIKHQGFTPDTPTREGYKVVYPDGYTSWSPKHVFETAYREIIEGEKDLIFPPETLQESCNCQEPSGQ